MKWTDTQVREELPNVKVRSGKKLFDGMVSGRRNLFANVHIETEYGYVSREYAWPTITNALNADRPLTF